MWPISGDRWVMGSPDGSLIDVHIILFGAMRDVAGKQTHPREAEQIDQFELPVSDEDRNWVRPGHEARAVISNRQNLPQSICKPGSGFDWEGQTLSLRDGFVRSAVRQTLLFRSLPQIRCQSQGLLMHPWSLCILCLLTGAMAVKAGL